MNNASQEDSEISEQIEYLEGRKKEEGAPVGPRSQNLREYLLESAMFLVSPDRTGQATSDEMKIRAKTEMEHEDTLFKPQTKIGFTFWNESLPGDPVESSLVDVLY